MALTLANSVNDMRLTINDLIDDVANLQFLSIGDIPDVNIDSITNNTVLVYNSDDAIFEPVSFNLVAGSNTQIQFNSDGSLGADANLVFDLESATLTVPNANVTQLDASNVVTEDIQSNTVVATDVQSSSANVDSLTANTLEVTTGNVDSLTANSVDITSGNVNSLTANTLEVTTGNVDSLTANSVEITSGNVDSLTVNTINASGVVCASSFEGDGSSLTGIDLTNLSNVESLTFDSTGDEEFGIPFGNTAQRPINPTVGYMRYNNEIAKIEVYSGVVWATLSVDNVRITQTAQLNVAANDAKALPPLEIEYLVIGGGGGGGRASGGGGGAGGYRSSVSGESSGGGASAEPKLELDSKTNYTITVGAGGSGNGSTFCQGTKGSNTIFYTVNSEGGGFGPGCRTPEACPGKNGGSGGGAAGRCTNFTGGNGIANQGFSGGSVFTDGCDTGGAGGGGASETGQSVFCCWRGGSGGDGVSSSITGTSVFRAGGGGGGAINANLRRGGIGGCGGGGLGGGNTGCPESGVCNSGGGGGGAHSQTTSGSGGSGVVILRYPSAYSINIGAGLCGTESTVGSNKVATITSGTGCVCFD